MRYIVYKTTSKLNGKMYIGVHDTRSRSTNYLGSGALIQRAIKKHGVEAFVRETLFEFETQKEAFEKEAELVTQDWVARKDTYNLIPGGTGGIEHQVIDREKQYRLISEGVRDRHQKDPGYRERISAALKGRKLFLGKKHTDETKRAIGRANSISQLGDGNSQFGTCWITNGVESTKIKKDDHIPDGWWKGRKMKRVVQG